MGGLGIVCAVMWIYMWTTLLGHITKIHITPHFNHFETQNVVVSLRMLLASHNVDVSSSAAHHQQSHVAPHFSHGM